MPWLLSRSILLDLLRTGLVITIVLVTVIAFGATLKPLARQDLISVGQAVRYVILAMVPMLQFALPFAAGFAGTLTMHRMASENELVAAAASGISYPRLLAPVAALGAVLLCIMLVLTQNVIPRFLARLAEVLERDVALLFQASVGRGEALRVGDLQIWADDLVVIPAERDGENRLMLFRVAVANVDAEGRVEADLTAERITVTVRRTEEGSHLDLDLADAVVYKPSDGMLAWIERPDATSIQLPGVRDIHIRSMTGSQLRALRQSPERFPAVRTAFRAHVEALEDAERRHRVLSILEESENLRLTSATEPLRSFEVEAADFRAGAFSGNAARPVLVTERVDGRAVRRYRAEAPRLRRFTDTGLRTVTAGLTLGTEEDRPRDRFELVMEECEWIDEAVPGVTNRRSLIRIEDLILPPGIDDPEPVESLAALRARVERLSDADRGSLRGVSERLDHQILRLERRIEARLARRNAVAFTAPLMLLTGCTLAMLLRRRSPLVIYLVAFLPAILALILISGGEQVMRDGRPLAGTIIMWSGNAGSAFVGITAFLRLRRN